MNFVKLFISRYALATSLSAVIVLTGLVGYGRIGLDRTPNVEFPVLNVSTRLNGASPQTIAQTVTQPLEAQLNTIAGIDTLSSTSVTGQSNITVTFNSGKNMAEALNDVQGRLGQAVRALPADAEAPVVRQFDLNSSPVAWLTLSGSENAHELTVLAKQIQKRLESVSGVGEVQLRGEAERVLQVSVDDARLSALGLTYADIQNAFGQNHLNAAGGRFKTPGKEYQVELNFEMATPEALATLGVGVRDGRAVRLGEVANISQALADNRGFSRYNQEPTLAIGIVKSSGVNPVELLAEVERRLVDIRASLPGQVKLTLVSDEASPIGDIVKALQAHLIEGTLLTALVVWLFLKSLRATSIVATAIPVSLAGAVAALYFFGYTFNTFTLLALLLLIGVVVDDAIVVLENIYRTREHNPELSAAQAAEKGAGEVLFAVMAATLTLVCVFGPVVFLPGVLGQFFTSFAVTVVMGVLVSWFVSMTLIPMLCAKFLRVNAHESPMAAWLERRFRAMEQRYRALLSLSLRWRWAVLALAAASLLPAVLFLGVIKSEFSPVADEGRIAVKLDLPAGQGKDALLVLAEKAEQRIAKFPDVVGVLTTFSDGSRSGSDSLSLSVQLKDDRATSQAVNISQMRRALSDSPDWRAQVSASSGGVGGSAGGPPLQFFLKGASYAQVEALSATWVSKLSGLPSLAAVQNNQSTGLPQLRAVFDSAAAARLGVSAKSVAGAVAGLNGQLVLGRYTGEDGDRHDISLRSVQGVAPESLQALGEVRVRAASGALVPLASVVRFEPSGAAVALQRVNQQYAVSFSGTPSETSSLGEVMAEIKALASELPAGVSIEFAGQAAEFSKVGPQLAMVLGLALVLLYLVLASQFNSFVQPVVVMLAQPLAVIGGLGALALSGQSLNIYSMIGLVLLVGLVAKNSILLVDRTNQMRLQGLSVDEALLQACPQRLRPVLMTSLTVIFAMLPAALGLGAGAENNQPLAVAIIGGMFSSTLLTLVVVPAAYSLVGKRLPA